MFFVTDFVMNLMLYIDEWLCITISNTSLNFMTFPCFAAKSNSILCQRMEVVTVTAVTYN